MKHFHKQDVQNTGNSRAVRRRTFGVFAAVAMGFGAIGGNLVKLQLVQHDLWQQQARDQQLTTHVVSDKRGQITDRNGVVLAQSTDTVTILMEPDEIPDEADRVKISDDLSALLAVDRETLYKKTGKVHSLYETVKTKLDTDTEAAFVRWVEENGYTGIFRLIRDYKRTYPFNNTLSCVLGFTGTDNTGLEGLEAKYNSALAGKSGSVLSTKNGRGDALPNTLQYETAVESGEGNHLTLTVDTVIQRIAEKHLEVAVAETAAADRACAIVMDVKTGAVLAMATKNDYDLNQPRVLTDADTEALLAQLSGNDRSAALLTALQQQWKNKAVSEFYEPGSVFKIFTASMALEEKLVSESSSFYCNGTFTMPGVRTMKCHVYPRSHGSQSLAEAISHSCNPAFMTIGSRVGTTLFAQYHQQFGFTELTGIDMLGEGRVTASLYHTADRITAVDVATSSIGQTFKVTPIQLITAVSAVANGGNLMKPYVVSRITAPDGTVVSETVPTVRRRVISEDTSRRICALLEGVVDGGGAKNAYVAGYRVAGKTGTSEKTDQKGVSENGRKGVVASFCGFAPADDPRVAVLVMIDEPQTAIRYGGTLAAPVAQKIFSEILPYLGVEAVYTEQQLKTLTRTVPAVTDGSVSAAATKLQSSSLTYRTVGTGTTVLRQSPAAGQPIPTGGTVILYTDDTPTDTVIVPAVTGKTLTEANKRLTEAGCQVILNGWTDRDASSTAMRQAIVASQDIAPETEVSVGTAVTITVRYQDSIE